MTDPLSSWNLNSGGGSHTPSPDPQNWTQQQQQQPPPPPPQQQQQQQPVPPAYDLLSGGLSSSEMERHVKSLIPTDGQFSSDGEFTHIAQKEVAQLGGDTSGLTLDAIKMEMPVSGPQPSTVAHVGQNLNQGHHQQNDFNHDLINNIMNWQHNSASSSNPSILAWPGDCNFTIRIPPPQKSKDAQFSNKLAKLFINQNRAVQIFFAMRPNDLFQFQEEGLFIRALPVYTRPDDFQEVVKVCRQHSCNAEGQIKHENARHLVQCCSNETMTYLQDPTSDRLSVLISLPKVQPGSYEVPLSFKFSDLGSCPGGLNRRETAVIFTLEHWGEVIGRQVLPVRICTCPKRDMESEEKQDKKNFLSVNLSPGEGKVKMDKSETKEYWVLARGKKNYEALKKVGEVIDQNAFGNSFAYNEKVTKYNNDLIRSNHGSKRKKIDPAAVKNEHAAQGEEEEEIHKEK